MLLKFTINFLIKIFCLMMIFLLKISGDCSIEFVGDADVIPKFERNIGKFKISISLIESEDLKYIKIYDGETVNGFCGNYFSPIVYEVIREPSTHYRYELEYNFDSAIRTTQKTISDQAEIALNCRGSTLFYKDQKVLEQKLSCVKQNYSIFSTTKPYSWCENKKNSGTFLFATDKEAENRVLAAICFNLDQISLQALVYNTNKLRHNHLRQLMDTNGVNLSEYLDENLWNFKTSIVSDLSEELLQKKLSEISKVEEFLHLASYEVSSIVQQDLLIKYFKGYENILNIIWWHNLRVGNWRSFENTLRNYAQNNSFEVYVGTSGIVQYPTQNDCHKKKILEIQLGTQNKTIPAYIWTYLKFSDNLNTEFIVVGFNSPYAEYFSTNEVIFCTDICSNIPWLKEISQSFRYGYAGLMFCCSTDFIQKSNHLQGFPKGILMPPEVETVTAMDDLITEDVNVKLS